jgi:hypothetical protein
MKPAAGSSILAAALIVSLVWLSQARAQADELANDTNQIERLTPEHAKKLAAEFPGVRVVIEGNIGTSFIERSLPLNGLKSLDAEIVKALAEFTGSTLCPAESEAARKIGTGATFACIQFGTP